MVKKTRQGFLAILLSLAMLAGLLPAVTVTAAASGNTAPTAGFGQAMSFGDTFATVKPAADNSQNIAGAFTVEMWIQRTGPVIGADYVFARNGGKVGQWAVLAYTEGFKFYTSAEDLGVIDESLISVNDTNWHHIAYTYDGSVLISYLDGAESKRNTIAVALPNASDFCIGNSKGGANPSYDTLDELRLWNYCRSEEDIRDDMYRSISTADDDYDKLVFYCKFDEGSGQNIKESVKGATGTVYNMAPLGTTAAGIRVDSVPNPEWITTEDTPVSGYLIGSDADGDALTYSIVSFGSNGVVAIIPDTNRFTYTPAADFNGTDSFTYQVTDDHDAESEAQTVKVTVTPVNDAPVLTPATPALDDILVSETENAGQRVSSFADSTISDGDAGSLKGIAIVATVDGGGKWQYSTAGESDWTDVGTVSAAGALLLKNTDYLRFVPGGSAAATAEITYRAWDQTSGFQGNKVDVTTNGGATAFSSVTDTASIAVVVTALKAVTLETVPSSLIPGSTLSVATVTPAGATYSCEWFRVTEGGAETSLGTGDSYTVTVADLGCRIRVKAAGTGSYGGTATATTTESVTSQSTVTLDANGGTGGTASVTSTYGTAMPTITLPSRTGYDFNGFYDSETDGTKYYNADGSSTNSWDKTAATTLYARWTPVFYTVTYDDNGATTAHSGGDESYTIEDESLTLPTAAPDKTGYTFTGWKVTTAARGGSGFASNDMLTGSTRRLTAVYGDVTLTAQWMPKTYAVALNANGGIIAEGKDVASYTYGIGATLPVEADITKSGYTFGGWYDNSSFTGTAVTDISASETSNKTFYAKWTAQHSNRKTTTPTAPAAPVEVDGKVENIGTVETTTNTNGTQDTSVRVDSEQLEIKLAGAASGTDVKVTVPETSGAATAQLVVKNMNDMAEKEMTLSVQVDNVSYDFPAVAIDTAALMTELDAADPAKVPVSVTITELSEEDVTIENGELVLPPVAFNVTATYGGKRVEVETFEKYVRRVIEVPNGVDASKITTAVVVENDRQRHVPTEVFQKDGKWYAKINSLTNSTYALIYNEADFADTDGMWYEAVVSEMASRGIIDGRSEGLFDGQANIKRAEFAAILVRALGLPENGDASLFSDVSATAWYCGAVGKALEYGLIEGRGNGRFDPNANITRQEAMAMVYRAAAITELAGTTGTLDAFSDADSISSWALPGAQWNVGSGFIQGSGGMICGQNYITRGETATIVLRLLQKSGLVDVRAQA